MHSLAPPHSACREDTSIDNPTFTQQCTEGRGCEDDHNTLAPDQLSPLRYGADGTFCGTDSPASDCWASGPCNWASDEVARLMSPELIPQVATSVRSGGPRPMAGLCAPDQRRSPPSPELISGCAPEAQPGPVAAADCYAFRPAMPFEQQAPRYCAPEADRLGDGRVYLRSCSDAGADAVERGSPSVSPGPEDYGAGLEPDLLDVSTDVEPQRQRGGSKCGPSCCTASPRGQHKQVGGGGASGQTFHCCCQGCP